VKGVRPDSLDCRDNLGVVVVAHIVDACRHRAPKGVISTP
jgi:hypothetical protein